MKEDAAPVYENIYDYKDAYLRNRWAIGFLGIMLGILLPVGDSVLAGTFRYQPTVSHYYFTGMSSFFVGILFAIGISLVTYGGYDVVEKRVGWLGGGGALLVALCPTTRSGVPLDTLARVHVFGALVFFISIAYLSYFRFPKEIEGVDDGAEGLIALARKRERTFKFCGAYILVSIVLIGVASYWEDIPGAQALSFRPPPFTVFFLEVLCSIAFGYAWLIKSRSLSRFSLEAST